MAQILIVDDDQMVRELLAMRLETKGHNCRQASDGAEGLGILDESMPDLIVLDMLMPTMDGLAFLEAAQNSRKLLPPVLILSATRVDPERVPQSNNSVEMLRKPASAAAILEAIESILVRS